MFVPPGFLPTPTYYYLINNNNIIFVPAQDHKKESCEKCDAVGKKDDSTELAHSKIYSRD